jgi:hypothetical protein
MVRGMADAERLEVDGETFDVAPDASVSGRYQFTWVSGKNHGYGFTGQTSDRRAMTREHMVSQIRSFLSQIDPETGYVAD